MSEVKIDPFDVDELQRSVNDSATRVSTIWLAFVAFSAYLAAAASNISHRQLFLEEPIKLPTINIDLPLIASAILLPLLLVIYHIFVLLQVVLLARTADAYNKAVDRNVPSATDQTLVRQRLSNTLFAQLFAGSPRERTGVLGWMLRAMSWISLAIAPVLVLVLFQIKFLPYHSPLVTWSHRLLLALDIAAILVLWTMSLHPALDFRGRALLQGIPHVAALGIGAIVVACSLLLFNYPGEHVRGWMIHFVENAPPTKQEAEAGQDESEEDRPPKAKAAYPYCAVPAFVVSMMPRDFDRIVLPREVFVNVDKVAKSYAHAKAKGLRLVREDRTQNFQRRDFSCAMLNETDLRLVDLTGAILTGIQLADAQMDGVQLSDSVMIQALLAGASLADADLSDANLTEAELHSARLPSADLRGADLKGAFLSYTNLEKADLRKANLQRAQFWQALLDDVRADEAQFQGAKITLTKLGGADLSQANLQGAQLEASELQGANLWAAKLQGARLDRANLRGANLGRANLQGASLIRSDLRGAMLNDVDAQGAQMNSIKLQGADLDHAQLQAANLDQSELEGANIFFTYLWRSELSGCTSARVAAPQLDLRLDWKDDSTKTLDVADRFINTILEQVPDIKDVSGTDRKKILRRYLQERILPANHWTDTEAEKWRVCEKNTPSDKQYVAQLTRVLVEVACLPEERQHYVIAGIYNAERPPSIELDERALAQGLLARTPKSCPGMERIAPALRKDIQETAGEVKKMARKGLSRSKSKR
ncbi:MAG TPA: pentapeptide repeat-containing protein [Bradyrhizobium sp.]|nr:pentapeptide repeat-containing protein [Bradyrhizobium sp.]